ncbi:hypothetical protein GE061_011108 [Apolygus lucorum]|uniref:MADF domain-containing protein n=1 Tax=Apolygus lucorum TaxID=248454 RepID=A0A8S9XXX7_APOLU|nr:hypothetical protein GE061_011108 [Apolygus lucorum]
MARARQNLEEFIIMYRDLPCLWKTSSKDYHDRRKKDAAYGKLVDKIREIEPSANKDFVIKKINNLRSSFRKELKKTKQWMTTGSGVEDVYQPKLWYFELLRFLYEQETPSLPNYKTEKFESESEAKNEININDGSERSNDLFDPDDTQSQTARDDPLGGKRQSLESLTYPTPPKRMTPMHHVTLTGDELQSVNEHNRLPTQDDRHDNNLILFRKNIRRRRERFKRELSDLRKDGRVKVEEGTRRQAGQPTIGKSVDCGNEKLVFMNSTPLLEHEFPIFQERAR